MLNWLQWTLEMTTNPYRGLPQKNFWKSAVAQTSAFDLKDLYSKKFDINPSDMIATAGSCFAQHIAARVRTAGYNYLDVEPAPFNLPPDEHGRFGYGLYSARYGNVYTARQLLQLAQRALGEFSPDEPVWEYKGRFIDPFRPTIEPDGFASREEFEAAQFSHFAAVRTLLSSVDVFVITLGLTEAWTDRRDGSTYPVAPGTAAGVFDPNQHIFHNFTFQEIYDDLQKFIGIVRQLKPTARFILTVSPVPLVATATDDHALVATTYSKSVLRAVAGQLREADSLVDYFPSYEVITGAPTRSMFFDPDLRSVNKVGVDTVMRHFFHQHPPLTQSPERKSQELEPEIDVVCDEMILAQAAPMTGQQI